jgi:hypothetical protein
LQSVAQTIRKCEVSDSGRAQEEGRESEVAVAVAFAAPIVADHSPLFDFGDLHHDLHRAATVTHERGLPLEVVVETSMSITNPAQLIAEYALASSVDSC